MIRKTQRISVKLQKNACNFRNNMKKLSINSFWQKLTLDKWNWKSMHKLSIRKKMKRDKEFKKSTKENLKFKKN